MLNINTIVYLGCMRNHKHKLKINKIEAELHVTTMKCLDCDGTGLFEVPNGEIGVIYSKENPCPYIKEQCIACKGTGYQYVSC